MKGKGKSELNRKPEANQKERAVFIIPIFISVSPPLQKI
jgi:hypothetical protein